MRPLGLNFGAHPEYAIEKSVFTVMTGLKLAVRAALLTAALTAVSLVGHGLVGQPLDPASALQGVLVNPWYQVALLVVAAVHLRLILSRMADKTHTL